MKSIFTRLTLILLSVSILMSCNTNDTQKGAGLGAVAGGVLGAVIGNNVGNKNNAALGAVIGAAVGGTTGGLIGHKMDQQARQIQESVPGASVERVGEGIKVVLNENAIRFDFDKATLTPTAQQNLDKIVSVFKQYPDTNIGIFGYTDAKGADQYNLNLSENRAKSVANYLSSNGISSGRFTIKGFGKADPIGDNSTEAGRALNRRVEFSITANEKMIRDAKAESN
ncbi:OmpA family protein [Apibacter sp. B3889]|uniref:OmpA family protein n=1 Tax=unclassified Apibacter TaxID=2630820 RepID=UPI00132191A5|nr:MULTISPECIES: OmpA family protein [unclassified Apibacter]MXO34001.1 OmpA family protein [Apibacter sp. B3883]MXO41868.1 OmpA family protein [Apibacter sp. B3889]MXP03438.1 OmpA family protein [Apibacter sp. B3887]MXP07299.1 OmpA family protein [Apibacter sp. B3935]